MLSKSQGYLYKMSVGKMRVSDMNYGSPVRESYRGGCGLRVKHVNIGPTHQ